MGMGFIEILLLIVMNGGGGTDLLDYVPTETYFQQHSVLTVTAEAMTRIAQNEDAKPTDRLMAIRALGELGDEASLAVLEPLTDSNEPFVGGYARRSIRWIRGGDAEPLTPIDPGLLEADLALLPSECHVIGQSRGLTLGPDPIDLRAVFGDLAAASGESVDDMVNEIAYEVLELVEVLGNIRLDALTFGMSVRDDGNGPGIVMLIARGQYDRSRLLQMFEEEESGMAFFSIDDIEVASIAEEWGEQFVFMMPSDERMVFMFSEREGVQMPIDETSMLIQDGETAPALGGVLLDELEQIDRANTPIWMAMEVPPGFKQGEAAEVLGAFDAVRMVGHRNAEGGLVVDAAARGRNAGAVAQTVDVIRGYINEGIEELSEEMEYDPAMAEVFGPIVEMLQSIELNVEGTEATGTMTLPNAGGGIMQMLFFGI
jgi:hypothetical protein